MNHFANLSVGLARTKKGLSLVNVAKRHLEAVPVFVFRVQNYIIIPIATSIMMFFCIHNAKGKHVNISKSLIWITTIIGMEYFSYIFDTDKHEVLKCIKKKDIVEMENKYIPCYKNYDNPVDVATVFLNRTNYGNKKSD